MARTKYDWVSKSLLDIYLSSEKNDIETQKEVHSEPQAIDVFFQPAPDHVAAPHLGLLGRLATRACIFEPFRQTPGTDQILDCHSKQRILYQAMRRKARRTRASVTMPDLWILSTGMPIGAIKALHFIPDPEWPDCIFHAPEGFKIHLVVLRKLPETADTLTLRLLKGDITTDILAELKALPKHPWVKRTLSVLLAFQKKFSNTRGKNMQPFTKELLGIYDDMVAETQKASHQKGHDAGMKKGLDAGMKKGLDAGMKKGLHQGVRESLLRVYRARLGEAPRELVNALDTQEDLTVLQGWLGPFATLTSDELYALVVGNE